MTKIIEKSKQIDVHLHIDKAYKIISDGLPTDYVEKVRAKLPNEKGLTPGIVRNLKSRITLYPKSRINVLTAIVEVAKEYQAELEKLEKLTN